MNPPERASGTVAAGNQVGLALMIESLTSALASDPNPAVVYVRRGIARHHLGDLAGAIADYTEALALQPQFAEAYNNRGVGRHRLGEFTAALADFDAAIQIKPQYAEAYNNRGTSRQALGDLVGARADYDQAIQLNPPYAEACNNRGTVRRAQGDLTGAIGDFDAAIRLNPRYAEAYDNRGSVHALLWNHPAAIADFDAALALYGPLSPDSAVYCRLHIHRGDAGYHLGDVAGLVARYRLAFHGNMELAARLVVERLAVDVRANLNRLIADCLKHLRRNPHDVVAWSRRGLVWLLLGKDAEAEADSRQFYRVDTGKLGALHEALITQAKLHREKHGPITPDADDDLGRYLGCSTPNAQ